MYCKCILLRLYVTYVVNPFQELSLYDRNNNMINCTVLYLHNNRDKMSLGIFNGPKLAPVGRHNLFTEVTRYRTFYNAL
jgi:hypothetical protein